MNLFRYKRTRIFKMFLVVTLGAVSVYIYYFSELKSRDLPSKSPDSLVTMKVEQITEQKRSTKTYDIMKDRLKHIQDGCTRPEVIYRIKKFRFPVAINSEDPFYTYKRSKTCMCKVPKVASTMLSKLLLASEYPRNISFIQKMPGYYVHASFFNYRFQRNSCSKGSNLNFLVVRNPYTRIFSAYIDKIFLGKFNSFASEILYMVGKDKKSRNYFRRASHVSSDFLCTHHDVSFESFLRWILFHYKVDWHFAPITRFCNPCEHPFDVIIKQENSRDEMKYVTQQLPIAMDTSLITDSSNDNKIKDLIMILHDLWNSSETSDKCTGIKLNYTFLNERFWDTLKIQGYISRDFNKGGAIFRPYFSADETFERYLDHKVTYLSSTERSTQRQEYLVEAYKTVDKSILKQFKSRFYSDFLLFDYSFDPPS